MKKKNIFSTFQDEENPRLESFPLHLPVNQKDFITPLIQYVMKIASFQDFKNRIPGLGQVVRMDISYPCNRAEECECGAGGVSTRERRVTVCRYD